MIFANIEYLFLLLLLIPYIVWYILRQKKSEATLQISDARVYAHTPKSYKNYLLHVPFLLRVIALVLVILVLARPQTTNKWQNSEIEGIDIMLAIDVSTSMLAEDLKPNRLEAAKDVAAEFINGRPNDNIGITLFAGETFTQCPLTVDHAVLLDMIHNIKCGLIEDGTAVGMGIANAVTRLKDSKAKSKVIILLTDGTNNKGDISPLTAAEIAKSFGIRVYTIGVGTNGMAPYPYPVGNTVQYVNMPVEIDEKTLTQIAGTTDGNYFRATSNSKLKEVYEEIDKLEKTKLNVKEYSKRDEEYQYLYLLLLLPFLAVFYLYSNYRRRKNIRRFGDPVLLAQLMPDVSKYRPDIKFWIIFVVIGLFSVLLARPQFGSKQETVKRKGVEVIIALDISNSMLAQDVQPSRLEKAKRLISRLVDELDNDKIGMIVFAGDAFTQLPITSDYISAKMFLESISPSLISKQGTAIGEAINLAVRSFTPQEGVGRAIVVITDGENHEGGAVEAAKVAAEKGIQVSVLGVGMPDGAPIPIEGTNDYRRDREGNVIVTRLNEAMCQEIAKEGKGIYVRVDNTNSAQKAINQEVNKMAKSDVESKVYTEFNEQFQAIAWIILILLLAELLILDRKNPLFKNVHLFSNKK